jgi:AraC-like DNA-binding protein
MSELLALSGIEPSQLADPDAMVPADVAVKVLSRIEAAIPGRSVALELSAMTPPSVFGLLDLATQNAVHFAEMIDIVLRYLRLTTSHAQAWLERPPGALAAFRYRHLARVEALRHPMEVGLKNVHRALVRAGAPPSDIVEVHFAHALVGPRADYEAAFGCPVFFESFGHALVMRRTLLERPIRHGDPVLSRSLVARLEAELDLGTDALAELRRSVARHAHPARYSAAALARRMGMSLRSLQREAAALGTTVSRILEEVRIARARELLLDTSLSVDEVSFLVEYSERAAFGRAFKRATGETPVDYRRRVAN